LLYFETVLNAQNTPNRSHQKIATVVVTDIYDLVSFKAGEKVDWEKVKSLFTSDAIIVLCTSPFQHSFFSTAYL